MIGKSLLTGATLLAMYSQAVSFLSSFGYWSLYVPAFNTYFNPTDITGTRDVYEIDNGWMGSCVEEYVDWPGPNVNWHNKIKYAYAKGYDAVTRKESPDGFITLYYYDCRRKGLDPAKEVIPVPY